MTVDGADPRRVLALIPAFNEQDCIVTTIAQVHLAAPEAAILVIDDASTDATGRLAAAAGAEVLGLGDNQGTGGAIRAGYRVAAAGGYDVAVRVDADGQHDPRDIPVLLTALSQGGADVVVGSRFAAAGGSGGSGGYRVGFGRRWAIGRLCVQVNRLTGLAFTDPTSGYRAVGRRAIELYAEDADVRFLGDTVEALLTAIGAGLTIVEVPVVMRARQGGRASIGLVRSAVGFLRTTRSIRRRSPLQAVQPAQAIRACSG
ncbi:MAG: glycosyltransferase family 2 protein [Actinomycetota bacterium]|nr:glycosyltransferase family 2 protein [Actinomycetota bacterium]